MNVVDRPTTPHGRAWLEERAHVIRQVITGTWAGDDVGTDPPPPDRDLFPDAAHINQPLGPQQKRVLEALRRHGPTTLPRIAYLVNRGGNDTWKTLASLADRGLVAAEGPPRNRTWRAL